MLWEESSTSTENGPVSYFSTYKVEWFKSTWEDCNLRGTSNSRYS